MKKAYILMLLLLNLMVKVGYANETDLSLTDLAKLSDKFEVNPYEDIPYMARVIKRNLEEHGTYKAVVLGKFRKLQDFDGDNEKLLAASYLDLDFHVTTVLLGSIPSNDITLKGLYNRLILYPKATYARWEYREYLKKDYDRKRAIIRERTIEEDKRYNNGQITKQQYLDFLENLQKPWKLPLHKVLYDNLSLSHEGCIDCVSHYYEINDQDEYLVVIEKFIEKSDGDLKIHLADMADDLIFHKELKNTLLVELLKL